MKNKMKALSTVLLALIMIFAMSISTFAADSAGDDGVYRGNKQTFSIEKEILVYNDVDNTTVYGPGITYNYSIAKVDSSKADAAPIAGKTVTDKDGDTATIRNGVTDGVTLTDTQVVFSKDETVSATQAGTSLKKTIGASVSANKFTAAGIYRYAITETVAGNNTLTTVGITRPSGYDNVRYLDVYIKNGNDGPELAGYVLFAKNDSISGNKSSGDNNIDGKTKGFVDAYDKDIDDQPGSYTEGKADKYYTYNYTIKKTVAGAMGDKTHQFPFTVETSGAVSGQIFTVVTAEGTATEQIGTSYSTKLNHNAEVTLKGLPANTKIKITETNDTEDTYKVGAVDTKVSNPLIADTSVAAGGTAATQENAVSNYTDSATPQQLAASLATTTFTNTLNEVSPTNVVMRYAPYLFILGAGVMLLMVSRRRKAEQE